MAFPNQEPGFVPNKRGVTKEDRELILSQFREFMMKGHSAHFFSEVSPPVMRRLRAQHSDFRDGYERIIREANAKMEERLIRKMDDDGQPINLKAWELLTRNRKGFRPEPEEQKQPEALRIEIDMIDSREKAEDARDRDNSITGDVQ